MSLFSFFRKNKQDTQDGAGAQSSAADEPVPARARSRRKASDAEPEDPILPEKKRARRRLIGAVALVLAVVIGLPMILDPEPKRPVQDIEISIPSRDKASVPRRLPAAADPAEAVLEPVESDVAATPVAAPASPSPSPSPSPSSAAGRTPASASVAAPATGASGETAAAAPARLASATPATPAAPAAAQTPARKPSSGAPAAASVVPAAPAQDARDREAARALAILEGKPVPAAAAASKPSRYTVQVAALASQEKIDELRNKLKAAGIASQTSKVPTASGERTRVRVGPFASKEDAEAMRARLVKLGLNGTLVPLD